MQMRISVSTLECECLFFAFARDCLVVFTIACIENVYVKSSIICTIHQRFDFH